MTVISNAFRVPMRLFTFNYFVISSICVKSLRFAQGGHLWQLSTK